jgi:hypothetical protein
MINELFKALVNFEMQEEVFIICALEILIFIGPTEITLNQLNVLTSLLSEESLEYIWIKIFKAIYRQGFLGVKALIQLAN